VLSLSKQLFQLGKEVIQIIKKANYEAFFVGGCVRDLLLQEKITDIDIATNATPNEITALFHHVIPIGIEHGTVIVRYKKHSFEVTTYRTEGTYSDKRHPDYVNFITSIEEDLKRRDFTINALAMDETGEIIDLFNGQEDLKNQRIKAVGQPKERFEEDPLRIIRALRFSSQLGFTIEKNTLEQMKRNRKNLQSIAIERINEEMRRFFASEHISKGILYLKQSKVYEQLPIFKEEPLYVQYLFENFIPLTSFAEVIAYFYLQNKKYPIQKWIREWKCSNKVKKDAQTLVQSIESYQKNGLHPMLVFNLPEELFNSFVRLTNFIENTNLTVQDVKNINNSLIIHSKNELNIKGNDLIEYYSEIKPGPWIEHMLKRMTEKVVLQELENDYKQLKEWVKCNPPKEI